MDGYTYDVFGSLRSQSGSSDNPWLFTGEQRDADSEMYYLRARYYDPAIGRFLSQDPVPGHPYAYVRNNPVRLADPSGLCPFCPVIPVGITVCALLDPCRDLVGDAAEPVIDYVTDPWNIATALQGGALIVGTVACTGSPSGVGLAVCGGAMVVYTGATFAKFFIVCEDVKAGKYSPEEGKARTIVGTLPGPKGPSKWAAEKIAETFIADMIPIDPGRCKAEAADNCAHPKE